VLRGPFVRIWWIFLLVALVGGLLSASPAPAEVSAPGKEAHRDWAYRSRVPTFERSERRVRRPSISLGASRSASVPVPAGPGFQAIEGRGITPADPTGAAGTTHVVTAVNVHYAVYTRAGTEVIGPERLKELFPRVPFPFDPKVVYDPYRQHFVLIYLGGRFFGPRKRSWINVVSMPEATVGAPSTWCKRKLKGDQVSGFGNLWADYPGLGFDGERVYITSNQFTFSRPEEFRYAQIIALRKNGLYDCDRPLRKTVFARAQTRDPGGIPAFTIQPAVTESVTTASPPEFLVSFQDVGCPGIPFGFCGRRLTVWRILETSRGLRLARTALGVGRAVIAPFGTQEGGGNACNSRLELRTCWDTGDLRLINAFYDADRGRLYTAHAVGADVGGTFREESVVRWYEIDPAPLSATSVPRRDVFGEANTFAGWPTVGTDADENLFVTYSRATSAGSGEYLSVWAATIAPGTETAEPSLIEEGRDTYVDPENPEGPQRWGDYNAISRDPLDPSVMWSVNQEADDGDATTGEVTDVWQQWVHPLEEGP
jgi:hypothetical protein